MTMKCGKLMSSQNSRITLLTLTLMSASALLCAGDDTPEAAAQLQEIAATLLGVDADTLARDAYSATQERWNGRDTAELITYRSVDAQGAPVSTGGGWVTLVADPVAVKTAGWYYRPPAAGGEGYLGDQELERAAREFFRTRLPHFSERSLVTRADTRKTMRSSSALDPDPRASPTISGSLSHGQMACRVA